MVHWTKTWSNSALSIHHACERTQLLRTKSLPHKQRQRMTLGKQWQLVLLVVVSCCELLLVVVSCCELLWGAVSFLLNSSDPSRHAAAAWTTPFLARVAGPLSKQTAPTARPLSSFLTRSVAAHTAVTTLTFGPIANTGCVSWSVLYMAMLLLLLLLLLMVAHVACMQPDQSEDRETCLCVRDETIQTPRRPCCFGLAGG